MKKTKKFMSYLLALVLVFGTFNPMVKADPPGYDGIINYALSTDASETVVANYDKDTKVLTVSGNGHIDKALWEKIFLEKCADFTCNSLNGNATIRFEVAQGEDIYFPADSSNLFSEFFGSLEGLNDVNVSEVLSMAEMFMYHKNFSEALNWDLSNVNNISSMFLYSNYNYDLNFDIDNAIAIEDFAYLAQIKNATFNNASNLNNNYLFTNGLDNLTFYGVKAGNIFFLDSGSYNVEKFDGTNWNNVGTLDFSNSSYEIVSDGDYRVVTMDNLTDINDCTITYNNTFELAGDDYLDSTAVFNALNLEIKDNNNTLVLDTHYEIADDGTISEVNNMSIDQGVYYLFSIGGLGSYTGTINIVVFVQFPRIEGQPSFNEITESGHELSEVTLGIGSLDFNNNSNFEIHWLNDLIASGIIEIEQGKEYWYIASGDAEVANPREAIISSVIPWPADPGPGPGSGIIGGDIIPMETEEVEDEEVPQASPTFTDVPADNMYFEAVEYLHEQGIIEGVTDTLFMPDMTTSRAVAATVLYRMAGKPSISGNQTLSDVMPEHWFFNEVTWGVEQGVIEGYDDGTFKPDVKLSKEQIIAMLHRYAKTKEGINMDADYDITSLGGYDMLEPYAMEAMKWAYKQGIVSGEKICPKKEVTRGELADMLMKFMEK